MGDFFGSLTNTISGNNWCPKDKCFEPDDMGICTRINQGEIVFFNYYNDFKDNGTKATYIGQYKECDYFMSNTKIRELHLTNTFKINIDKVDKVDKVEDKVEDKEEDKVEDNVEDKVEDKVEDNVEEIFQETGNKGSDGTSRFVFNRIEKDSFIYGPKREQEKNKSTFNSLFGTKQSQNDVTYIKFPQDITMGQKNIDRFNKILDYYIEKKTNNYEINIVKPENSTPENTTPYNITPEISIISEITKENPNLTPFPTFKDSKTLKFGFLYNEIPDVNITNDVNTTNDFKTTATLENKLLKIVEEIKTTKPNIENLVKKDDFDKIQNMLQEVLTKGKIKNLTNDIFQGVSIYDDINNSVQTTFNELVNNFIVECKTKIQNNIANNKIKISYYLNINYITDYLIKNEYLKDKQLTTEQIKTLLKFTKSQFETIFPRSNENYKLTSERDRFKTEGWLFVGKVMKKNKENKEKKLTENQHDTLHNTLYIKPDGKIIMSDADNENFTTEVEFKLFHNFKGMELTTIKRLDQPIVKKLTTQGGKTKKLTRNLKTKKQRKNRKYNNTKRSSK